MADMAQKIATSALRKLFLSKNITAITLLLIATIVIRWPAFGDPNYHIDEGFYLLVGQKMHEGLIPYVDIWDRKPFGLFSLYWVISFFGDVYAYQVIAGLFVWATAITLAAIARMISGTNVAILCGITYIAALEALAGGGGQSPVFYNLLIAVSAFLTIGLVIQFPIDANRWSAPLAMFLCGLALTVKPTAVFESCFFGMALLWVCWRKSGHLLGVSKQALLLMLIGAAPTLLIFLAFAFIGHFDDYWFATFQSIFLTGSADSADSWIRIRWLLQMIVPLTMAGMFGMFYTVSANSLAMTPSIFIFSWFIAATIGFLVVPNYYDHYAIPLVAPLSVACAGLFGRRSTGKLYWLLVTGWMLYVSDYPRTSVTAQSQSSYNHAKKLIGENIKDGCLFVFDAPPALYRGSKMCRTTRYIFPEHLSNDLERPSIGRDPVTETQAILADRPQIIIFPKYPSVREPNLHTRKLVHERLYKDYIRVGATILIDVVEPQSIEIWVLNSKVASQQPT